MARFTLALALGLILTAGCATEEFSPNDSSGGGSAATSSGATGGWKASGGGAGNSGSTATGGGGSSGSGGGKTPAGLACTDPADCASGFCFDGVCCQSDCSGTCESCNLSGSAGSCQPYPDGTDPESECPDAQKTTTGLCAGRCDGNRACKMPGSERHCGQTLCTGAKQTAEVCDGNGSCVVQQQSCAPFSCDNAACATSCKSDAQCADPTTWCKAGSCAQKLGPSSPCSAGNQCSTGNCVDGVCCTSSACAAPSSCSTGVCTCGSSVCAPGASCVPFYEDADGDGFGDKTKNILACANGVGKWDLGGKIYVANSSDCFDGNKNAFPGQTAYFGVHRGDGSFDYDCSGIDDKKYVTITNPVCRDCHGYGATACSLACGNLGLQSMGVTCNLPNDCGGPKDVTVFAVEVGCGGLGELRTCSTCNPNPTAAGSLGTVQQTCR